MVLHLHQRHPNLLSLVWDNFEPVSEVEPNLQYPTRQYENECVLVTVCNTCVIMCMFVLCVLMYVWMYVCMYVCLYVCKYIYMYVCIYIYICMYVCKYVCIYVCIHVWVIPCQFINHFEMTLSEIDETSVICSIWGQMFVYSVSPWFLVRLLS